MPVHRTPFALALLLFLSAACGAAQPGSVEAQGPTMGTMSRSIESLAANINDAIVQVRASGYAPISGAASSRTSLLARRSQTGSGIIVSADGYIVTNAHVVAGANRVHVHIPPSENQRSAHHSTLGPAEISVPAEIVGVDTEADIAILKVDRTGLSVVEFGDSDSLETGQLVLAFGSPFGLEGTVTMGVVSAVARQVEEDSPMVYVQTDAAINPGNSGGALVDARGKLVGVNTFIASPSGASNGLGFAVPSNLVRIVYEQIREHGHVRRGIIGVHAQTVTPTLASGLGLLRDWGVVLSDVYPGGPAASAGLQVGDVVVSLDGQAMENARQFNVGVYARHIGDTVNLEVRRGEREHRMAVTVVERTDDPGRFDALANPQEHTVERFGIVGLDLDGTLRRLLPQLRSETGVVVAVSAAGEVFRPGDVIVAVNGDPTPTLAALRGLVGASDGESEDAFVVQIERAGRLGFVVVAVD